MCNILFYFFYESQLGNILKNVRTELFAADSEASVRFGQKPVSKDLKVKQSLFKAASKMIASNKIN